MSGLCHGQNSSFLLSLLPCSPHSCRCTQGSPVSEHSYTTHVGNSPPLSHCDAGKRIIRINHFKHTKVCLLRSTGVQVRRGLWSRSISQCPRPLAPCSTAHPPHCPGCPCSSAPAWAGQGLLSPPGAAPGSLPEHHSPRITASPGSKGAVLSLPRDANQGEHLPDPGEARGRAPGISSCLFSCNKDLLSSDIIAML